MGSQVRTLQRAPFLQSPLIQPTFGIRGKDFQNLIADAAEDSELLLFRTRGMRRIIEGPVVATHLTGKHGACLVGVAADGDDGFHLIVEEKIHVFRVVTRDIDANFFQRSDRERMNVACGFGACALDAETFTKRAAQDGFGKVGAAGISGAKDEDGRWFHEGLSV